MSSLSSVNPSLGHFEGKSEEKGTPQTKLSCNQGNCKDVGPTMSIDHSGYSYS